MRGAEFSDGHSLCLGGACVAAQHPAQSRVGGAALSSAGVCFAHACVLAEYRTAVFPQHGFQTACADGRLPVPRGGITMRFGKLCLSLPNSKADFSFGGERGRAGRDSTRMAGRPSEKADWDCCKTSVCGCGLGCGSAAGGTIRQAAHHAQICRSWGGVKALYLAWPGRHLSEPLPRGGRCAGSGFGLPMRQGKQG
ncbi:Uncharacterised protein [Kingella potus]|uniref:Uncharacterized protein n=1 Tax=Kingella potus TaxID=265175 RepID=A0A377R4R3_9NEIS|nr:Uncharacterised protein [Kingella potus]